MTTEKTIQVTDKSAERARRIDLRVKAMLQRPEKRAECARRIDLSINAATVKSRLLTGMIRTAKMMAEEEDGLYASINLDNAQRHLNSCEASIRRANDTIGEYAFQPAEEAAECAGKFRDLACRVSLLRNKIKERNTSLRQEIAGEIGNLLEEAQEIHATLPEIRSNLLNRVCP